VAIALWLASLITQHYKHAKTSLLEFSCYIVPDWYSFCAEIATVGGCTLIHDSNFKNLRVFHVVAMDLPVLIQLVDIIGLLLKKCAPHCTSRNEDDQPLYQMHTLYNKVDPLESREVLQSCCLCKVSSWELATAIVKIM